MGEHTKHNSGIVTPHKSVDEILWISVNCDNWRRGKI